MDGRDIMTSKERFAGETASALSTISFVDKALETSNTAYDEFTGSGGVLCYSVPFVVNDY